MWRGRYLSEISPRKLFRCSRFEELDAVEELSSLNKLKYQKQSRFIILKSQTILKSAREEYVIPV